MSFSVSDHHYKRYAFLENRRFFKVAFTAIETSHKRKNNAILMNSSTISFLFVASDFVV